jgi:hypothetical protein
MLEVGTHNTKRVTEWFDAWKYTLGFKDGMIDVIGNNSQFNYCNQNLTLTNSIYYFNYKTLFAPDVVATKFNVANR